MPRLSFLQLVVAFLSVVIQMVLVEAVPLADEVLGLPGWNAPLPSRHFSGFVSNDDDAFLHYYWVFPEVAKPQDAPVIFWTNGGPGCSSMEGWAYELGPFRFMYWNTTAAEGINGYNGTAPFARNPYTWARNAHVVFVENPPGVGFSYRTDNNNFAMNDTANALSNYNGLVHLFRDKFPEFIANGLYLAGESYAGIYVPMLAQMILNEKADSSSSAAPVVLSPGFRGIVVGNGVTDNTFDNNFATSTGLFAVDHGLILTEEFQKVVTACQGDGSTNEACLDLWDSFSEVFDHLNWYGFAGWCYNPDSVRAQSARRRYRRARRAVKHSGGDGRVLVGRGQDPSTSTASQLTMWSRFLQQQEQHHQRLGGSSPPYRHREEDPRGLHSKEGGFGVPHNGPADYALDCGDEVFLDRYLSRADVRAAMNVPLDFVGDYRVCYDIPYTSNVDSVVDIYNLLMQHNKTIVIYNGDMDLVVPYTGTFQWIARSTEWVMTRSSAPWVFIDEDRPAYGLQTGGQAFQLSDPKAGSGEAVPPLAEGVWVVLVNGAGHMVPEDRPAAAFEMIQRIVSGAMFVESPVVVHNGSTTPTVAQRFVAPDVAAVAYGVGGLPSDATSETSFWDDHRDLIVGILIGVGAAQLWCTIIYVCFCRRRAHRSAMPFAMAKDDQGLFASPDRYM